MGGRLRRLAAARPGRDEEGEGVLAALPPVRRRGGTGDGAGQRRRPPRGPRAGDRRLVPRDARPLPLRAAPGQGQLQRPRGRLRRDPAARPRRQPPLLRLRGGGRGARGVQAETVPGLRQVPETRMRIWLMAARPRTLPAAIAPVLVGTAAAVEWAGKLPRAGAFIAALIGSIFIQIGTNLANDYSDARRGADTADRLGPVRGTSSGLGAPTRGLIAAWIAFAVAGAAGIYLATIAGVVILIVGAASILAGVLYTGGPRPYGYEGLGELFVFLFFGLVAVNGSYYVQLKRLDWLPFGLSLAVGFLATAILVVNNVRDVDTDRRAGKMTLAVRLGRQRTRNLYASLIAAAFVAVPVTLLATGSSAWGLLMLVATPLVHPPLTAVMTRTDGPALNGALAGTGALLAAFSALLSLGLLLGA